jgi:hypothetical protein
MGSVFSMCVKPTVPLLHRPTSLSTTYDEMTQAVRFMDKIPASTGFVKK